MIPYGGMKENNADFPCHQSQLTRLKRAEGQIRGISKMIDEGRYCIDILTQLKAIKSAISAIESNILESHINHCVEKAIESKDAKKTKEAVKEIKDLLKKR